MKEFLTSLDTNIISLLPYGAVEKLAEKHKVVRQTASAWLKGNYGEKNTSKALLMLDDAVKLIEQENQSRSTQTRKIKRRLSKFLKTA